MKTNLSIDYLFLGSVLNPTNLATSGLQLNSSHLMNVASSQALQMTASSQGIQLVANSQPGLSSRPDSRENIHINATEKVFFLSKTFDHNYLKCKRL